MASAIVAGAAPPPSTSWVESLAAGGLSAGAHQQQRSDPTTLPTQHAAVAVHFSPDFVVQNHPQPPIYDDSGAQLGRNGKGNRLLRIVRNARGTVVLLSFLESQRDQTVQLAARTPMPRAAFNATFGKFGRCASEEVIVELLNYLS